MPMQAREYKGELRVEKGIEWKVKWIDNIEAHIYGKVKDSFDNLSTNI